MSVTGRLCRPFPASGVAIPQERFDSQLRASLSSTLAKLSRQEVAGAKAKAKKEKKMHDEERDTTDPKMVTIFLTTLLLAHGRPAHCKTITKNTRDEVLYRSSLLPWRRSPTWLLVRVALQLSLSRCPTTATAEDGALYKEFMQYFLADILREAASCEIESDLLFSMYAKLERRLRKHVNHGAVRM
ncbi:hypothetical protein LEL_10741 [Akanthomyces lecanii RCEF 1005]|uniref:DUF6606 domain-containing protein n=1 Tax=Akanthomyces lecanii RCEF 1005 TaxID=1081108 RepID=A0A167UZY2_CORDF|nr:hypothetical protein LEL_10741 [Akanthomyces lecanii RCEF 1005]